MFCEEDGAGDSPRYGYARGRRLFDDAGLQHDAQRDHDPLYDAAKRRNDPLRDAAQRRYDRTRNATRAASGVRHRFLRR